MKIKILIASVFICALSWAEPFSLTQFSPGSQSIDGISFPRNGVYTYRGVEPKLFSFKDSVQAMFGDSKINVESMMMSAVKLRLQRKLDESENYFIKKRTKNDWWRKGKNDDRISEMIEDYINKNGGPFSEAESTPIAKSLLDQSYEHQLNEDRLGTSYRTIPERILNYRSEDYSDFPRDVLFTSLYQVTASIYGAGIIVIKEDIAKQRSIDLTYWNYVNNAFWKTGADVGEVLFPGYIQADEVAGYELHTRGNYPDKTKGGVPISLYGVQKEEPIDMAIYKHIHEGEVYILVFDGTDKDGEKRHCLRKGSDHRYYFCYRNGTPASFNPQPKLSKTEANLMGVIKLCSDIDNCEAPKKVFSQYKYYSKRDLPVLDQYGNGLGHGDVASIIKTIKIDGKQAKYFKVP